MMLKEEIGAIKDVGGAKMLKEENGSSANFFFLVGTTEHADGERPRGARRHERAHRPLRCYPSDPS